jgi:hypothetical protein
MIPDKNLFLVTSALRPLNGVWTPENRFSQTVETVKRIKEMVPDSIILFTDVSVNPVPQIEKDIIANYCNLYYDFGSDEMIRKFSIHKHQSAAETVLLHRTISHFKNEPFIKQVKRIFKVSGRTLLTEGFNTEEHNHFGKFIFKKRVPTWMHHPHLGATHLLITRMFSFCPSLIDNYLQALEKTLPVVDYVDFEHAHFLNIPKEYLLEFDTIHCRGWLSGGAIEDY